MSSGTDVTINPQRHTNAKRYRESRIEKGMIIQNSMDSKIGLILTATTTVRFTLDQYLGLTVPGGGHVFLRRRYCLP
jgi:hypothetical protein